MLAHLQHFFSPPVFTDDEDKTLTAKLLNSVILSLLVVVILAGGVGLFLFARKLGSLIVVLSLLGLLLIAYRFMQQGQIRLAGSLIVAGTWLLVTSLLFFAGGMANVDILYYIVITVFTGLLLGPRAAIIVAGLNIMTGLAMLILDSLGLMPSPYFLTPPRAGWLNLVLGLLVTTSTLKLALDSLAEALTRIRQELAERHKVEEALRTSEQKLRAIFEVVKNVSFIITDVDARILEFSPGAEAIFGYRKEEMLGQPVAPLHLPEDVAKFPEAFELMRQNKTSFAGETILVRKSGEKFPALFTTYPLFDAHGNLEAGLGVSIDITDRKQAEEAREKLIIDLETKNAELERFTYTVSHDLKSPIVTIKGFLGWLEKDMARGDKPRMHRDIEQIRNAAEKMRLLLDDLLELSRIGRLMNPSQAVPLDTLVREAVDLVAGQLSARGVRVDIAPNLPVVCGDRPRLVEVLQNLLDNAVKFMGAQPEPRIEIRARQEAGETVCYVQDNGVGIEPRYHHKIFGLFERLDQTVEGTGIGLALVKRIVEIHGGRIWVESAGQGQGSTFYFTLPRIKAPTG